MPNRVYDDEDQGHRQLTPSDPGLSDEELRQLTGIGEDEEQAMDREATSGAAQDILNRERNAAKGNVSSQTGPAKPNANIQRGGLGVPKDSNEKKGSGITRGGFGGAAATKLGLKAQENAGDGFFKPEAGKAEGKVKGKGRLTRRQKIGFGFALFGLLGGGGTGMFAIISGPLQFIHIGQLLSGLHLDEKNDEGDARMLKIAKYIRHYQKGEPERTRMGVLGNKVADRIEKKFNAAGIESQYSSLFGFGESIILDPNKLAETGHLDDLKDKTPDEVSKYFQDKYKITVTTGPDGRLTLDTSKLSFRQFNSLTRTLMRGAGYHYLSPGIGARFMGVRAGIDWHPIRKLDKKVLKTIEERFAKWKEGQKEAVRDGVRAAPVDARGTPQEDNKPPAGQDGADATNEVGQEAGAVGDDPSALEKFQTSIGGKITAGGASLIGVVCMAMAIANHIDEINQQNVILPMMRMGMDSVAEGNQVQDGTDVDQEQLGFKAGLLHDKKTNTSWSDALSINRELGKPGGVEIPETAKIDPEGNVITRFLGAIPGADAVCKAADSTIGSILLTGVGLVLGGPISGILGAAFGAVAGPLVSDWLAQIFSANQVDPLAAGADRGNFMNYGVRLAANDIATSWGGLPMSDADAKQLAETTRNSSDQEFQSKSLATKLFDANDRRSFIAQVIDTQIPDDPMANIARIPSSLLNINKSFASVFSSIFGKSVGAMPITPYDYGFPDYAFTEKEMNDTRVANPFENAQKAADILDANSEQHPDLTNLDDTPNTDNYIVRAKVCFGVDITKIPGPKIQGQNISDEIYTINPPVNGQIPTLKTIKDSDNQCFDGSENWFRVRFYIFDSQMMNAAGCSEQDRQACVDSGMIGNADRPTASGNALGCDGTSPTGGGSITGDGPLNNTLPTSPGIDPASGNVVGAFPEPHPYGNVYDYGVTVVCSSASDPSYTVSSGNSSWGPNPFDQQVAGATGTGSCNPLHIPNGTPIPGGSDKWVAVIDSTKPGLYCMMWVASNNGSSWSMEYGGVYKLNGGGAPVLAGSGSGSNIPQSPILAREIEAGVINHALAFASPKNNNKFRPPASKTDGNGSGPFEEGMRFQLDPSVNCAGMPTKAEKAICTALQVYGAYDVDNTGGGTGFFFQSNGDPSVYQAAGITGDYMQFSNIPLDKMRLLKNWEGTQ